MPGVAKPHPALSAQHIQDLVTGRLREPAAGRKLEHAQRNRLPGQRRALRDLASPLEDDHRPSYTTRPPSIVKATRVSAMWSRSFGSRMSRESTTRSASLPGSSEPRSRSAKAAEAAPRV